MGVASNNSNSYSNSNFSDNIYINFGKNLLVSKYHQTSLPWSFYRAVIFKALSTTAFTENCYLFQLHQSSIKFSMDIYPYFRLKNCFRIQTNFPSTKVVISNTLPKLVIARNIYWFQLHESNSNFYSNFCKNI